MSKSLEYLTDDLLLDKVHLRTDRSGWNGDVTNWKAVKHRSSHSLDTPPEREPGMHLEYQDPRTKWFFKLYSESKVLKIEGLVPRLLHSHNRDSLSMKEFSVLPSYLSRIQRSLGLSFPLDSLIPTRVDLAANLPLLFPTSQLIEVLSQVKTIDSMRQDVSADTYHKGSLRWRSRAEAFVIYDKRRQLQQRYHVVEDRELLRAEYQMKRQRSCAAHSFTHFKDLCDLKKQKKTWRAVNSTLIQKARELGSYSSTALADRDLTARISKIIRSPGCKAVDFYVTVASVGIMPFLNMFGGYEGFDSWLAGGVSNRSRKLRWMSFIQCAHLLQTERTIPPKHVRLWEVFELWVESVGWDMSVLEPCTGDPILELNTA